MRTFSRHPRSIKGRSGNGHGMIRQRRGFTLVEVVVVTVVSVILIVAAIGWVMGLVVTSSTSLAQSANTTNAAYINSRMSSDLLGAVDCNAYGLDTPFYSFSPTQIAFYDKVGTTSTTLSSNSAVTATTTTDQASSGASTISVVSVAGITVGQEMIIGDPSGVNDEVTVSGLGSSSVQFTPALLHTYGSGSNVEVPGASITPVSTSNIDPGTVLTIGTGATQETATVSYVQSGTVHLVEGLTYLHDSGESVTFAGGIDLVTWRVSDGTLQRAVIAGGATCNPTNFSTGYSAPTWVTIATGVDCQLTSTTGVGENCVTDSPNNPIFFQGYTAGVAQNGGTISSPLTCAGAEATECYFDTVTFSAQLVNQGTTGAALKFSQSFPVNLSGSRLGS
jgi:prepilin-type N-terminal cleavage/methylation domain-containing protein